MSSDCVVRDEEQNLLPPTTGARQQDEETANVVSTEPTRDTSEQHDHKPKSSPSQTIKYTISVILLFFCIQSVMCAMWDNVTAMSHATSPLIAIIVTWSSLVWLGVLEGGQGSLVGMQPIEPDAYRHSHPLAYRCTAMAYEGNNINRFIVGRQFFVVLVIFVLNLCCDVVAGTADVPGVPKLVRTVLCESGLAVMIITVIVGQLSAEVNATTCMLDFLNAKVVFGTTWFCLAIEESGLLHSVYAVPMIITWITGVKPAQGEEAAKAQTGWAFWIRLYFSCTILAYAMAATVAALLRDETTMYEGPPIWANIILFGILICFLGMLEAMQIALFAVCNLPEEDVHANPSALYNYRLSFTGNNFQAFLIGRQICVTISMFLLARITTTDVVTSAIKIMNGENPDVLDMPTAVQIFFNTGLPGALITTIVASLMWRIVASTFPVQFLGSPLVLPTIRLCLALEWTGLFSASWLLADAVKWVTGLKEDALYLDNYGANNKPQSSSDYGTLRSESTCSDDSDTIAESQGNP